jgi:hypothetical protein
MRREKPLSSVLTRQNLRAALRTESYKRVREEQPNMKRSERRKLARALAARAFMAARYDGKRAPEDCPLVRE